MPRFVLACALAAIFADALSFSAPVLATTAPEKQQSDPRADQIWQLMDPPQLQSASLSADGSKVVGLRTIIGGEAIIVIDWRSRKGQAVQSVSHARGQNYNGVYWKGDRIVFSVTQLLDRRGALISREQAEAEPDKTYVVRRLFSTNAEGTDLKFLEGDRPGGLNAIQRFATVDIVSLDTGEPDVILVAVLEERYKLSLMNVRTGMMRRLTSADYSTDELLLDGRGNVVMRQDAMRRGAGSEFFRRKAGTLDWIKVTETRTSDAINSPDFYPLGPGPGENQIYLIARPEGRDRAALYLFNTATGDYGAPVYEHPTAEVTRVYTHPQTKAVMAACVFHVRQDCVGLDPTVEADFTALRQHFGPDLEFSISHMSQDANIWLVFAYGPQQAGVYFTFDRATRRVVRVLDTKPSVPATALAPTRIVPFTTRDGVKLWSYVTGRRQPNDPPSPVVVLPHGGPEARDNYGFDEIAQMFAQRGYLVVQPHFRGSEGSGKAFVRAGQGQWGKRMQDDVIDAFNAMTASGEGDPNRACIVGWSYGGYAALMGMARDPGLFRCGASIAGVADLIEMLRYDQQLYTAQRSASYSYWRVSIGELGRDDAALAATSPTRLASAIQGPVLLIHGDEDVVVPVEQSKAMAAALKAAGKPHETQYFEDGDHGLNNLTQRWQALKRLDAFVASHIGA